MFSFFIVGERGVSLDFIAVAARRSRFHIWLRRLSAPQSPRVLVVRPALEVPRAGPAMELLILRAMKMQNRRSAIRHAMLHDRDAILPVRHGHPDGHQRVLKPQLICRDGFGHRSNPDVKIGSPIVSPLYSS